jgi:CheY-like chemotaxis protein
MTKIVIIDDMLSNALMLKGYLRSLAVETEIFTNPRLALTWCVDHVPDLVLLDYQMPGIDGGEFLQKFRADPRLAAIPVVVVTWHEDMGTLHRAFSFGATSVFNKPVDRVRLIHCVQDLIVHGEARCQAQPAGPIDIGGDRIGAQQL